MRSNPTANVLFFVENSRHRFVGKIRWTQKVTAKYPQIDRKIPADTPDKSTRIFTSICRGTTSHNVYLTENLPKLKTVYMLFTKSNQIKNYDKLICFICCVHSLIPLPVEITGTLQ